ncbi:tRNA (uracil-5-)-methyltransferase homolog A-like isoform X1 [Oncorhynchus masou masou]|uniref:tRNA (uracil-5-)-methyltransferase homolog A-like isoform X1 n=1 Tax=Oncorhynchus masou masou TaxID=90313 RepID=UPI0031830D5D
MTKSDVTALYFFSARQRQSPNPEDLTCELVAGEECIHEELLGLEFRISPYYFFQGVRKVIGIEMFQETEKDAKVNVFAGLPLTVYVELLSIRFGPWL